MEKQGYIKIYRKILDNFIYLDSEAVHLWLHLLLKANHSKKEFLFNGKKEILQIGQLIISREKISLETNINPSKVYRLLKILEREQLIEQQTNSHFTKVSVVNYYKYQNHIPKIKQQFEQPVNSQRTASEQPVNTNNNEENDKNDNNIYIYWQEKKIIVHKQLDDKTRRAIQTTLKNYSIVEICKAIDNYAAVLASAEHYFNHKWTLVDFLKRGLEKFLASADPLTNFKKDGVSQSKGVQVADDKYANIEVINAKIE